MDVSRRQGLLALATAVGAFLLKASRLGSLTRMRFPGAPGAPAPRELSGREPMARRRPSRTVEPDPHSVKRHA